ncbi:hypothetical protein ACQKCJ_02775 [Flavobacterium sp. NPDC079362]|uniref:hypothetical protein n=1 Tax=Flavobacterium sp. NPDC079362 TaxID=3390566 RepID=UPI003D02C04D
MNSLKIFDQTFTDDTNFVFVVLFDLLNNSDLEVLLPKEYNILLNKFNQNIEFASFKKLDLNIVLNDENKESLIKIFESIYSNRFRSIPKDENNVLKSKLFLNGDLKKIGKIIYKQLDNRINETDIYNTILNGLKCGTFYELSIVNPEELEGNWTSIKESGALRINYNMTDWTPLGSKIELKIEKFHSGMYKFICSTKVMDYNTRNVFLIDVYESNVEIKDGFFYHYNFESNKLIYKMPIYEFENETFKTQIADFEFVLQRNKTIK